VKKLNFTFPVGGAIHFRGIVGKVTLIDRPQGKMLTSDLDAQNTINGKKLIINYRDGTMYPDGGNEIYNEMQVFSTPTFEGGFTVISSKGVFDKNGKKAVIAKSEKILKLGVEIDYSSLFVGQNIWFGWMVKNAGRNNISLKADRKIIRNKTFEAKNRQPDKVKKIDSFSDLTFKIYPDNKIKANDQILVGDVVAFGFAISDLNNFNELAMII